MRLYLQVLAQVSAEVRTRLRSASTLVAVLVLFAASFLWIPDPSTNATSISWTVAGQRYSAIYGAAYVGTASAILSSLFLSLIGFYLVAGSVRRDAERGIGPILAATPLSNAAYLLGKAAASAAYLFTIGLLAMGGGLLVYLRHGVGPFSLAAFVLPVATIVLPGLLVTALMALLFDVTPGLRGRGGLVLWFFTWAFVLLVPVMDRSPGDGFPLYDPLGLGTLQELIWRSAPGAEGISIGLNLGGPKVTRVPWAGLPLDGAYFGTRAVQLLFGLVPFGLSLLFFRRFDPARGRLRLRSRSRPGAEAAGAAAARSAEPTSRAPGGPGGGAPPPNAAEAVSSTIAAPAPQVSFAGLPRAASSPSFIGAVGAEVRLVWDEAPLLRWPLLLAAVLAGVLPGEARLAPLAVFLVLLAPVISEVSAREALCGTEALVLSQPAVPPSCVLWKLGSVGLFVCGLGLLAVIRALGSGLSAGLAFVSGLLFVSAFAVAAGSLTHGGKLFTGVYVAIWYAAVNRAPAFDFTGAFSGQADLAVSLLWLAVGVALAGAAAYAEKRRAG